MEADELDRLVADVRGGDRAAFDAILEHYRPLVNTLARRYHIRLYDRADVRQECATVLYETILNADVKSGWGGYLRGAIHHHVIHLLRDSRAMKRTAAVYSLADEWAESTNYEPASPEDHVAEIAERDALEQLCAECREPLADSEIAVFDAMVDHVLGGEVGQLNLVEIRNSLAERGVEMTTSQVNVVVHRIRSRLTRGVAPRPVGSVFFAQRAQKWVAKVKKQIIGRFSSEAEARTALDNWLLSPVSSAA